MNITQFNTTNLDYPMQNSGIHFSEVLRDFCTQIDSKILLCSILILSYFILKMFILPKAYEGLKHFLQPSGYKWLLDDYITKAYEMALSLLETFGLGSAIFLIAIYYYQNGFPIWAKIIIWIYSFFLGSYIISFIIGKIRGILKK